MDFPIVLSTHFIDEEMFYDGSQLRSHWILKKEKIKGDAIVAFIGPCKVKIESLVDQEDVLKNAPIHSDSMLHFIAEHFDTNLERMILRQRLFISLIKEDIQSCMEDVVLVRRGDDLYHAERKLTVSIATKSPISCLMHTGINISSFNTPVPTLGLEDLKLNPHALARSVMNRYLDELQGVAWARSKVKGVP